MGLTQQQVQERIDQGLTNETDLSTDKTTKEIIISNTFTYFNPARPSPGAWRTSTAPAAGLSTRVAITVRRCTTTTPITRQSFTPC